MQLKNLFVFSALVLTLSACGGSSTTGSDDGGSGDQTGDQQNDGNDSDNSGFDGSSLGYDGSESAANLSSAALVKSYLDAFKSFGDNISGSEDESDNYASSARLAKGVAYNEDYTTVTYEDYEQQGECGGSLTYNGISALDGVTESDLTAVATNYCSLDYDTSEETYLNGTMVRKGTEDNMTYTFTDYQYQTGSTNYVLNGTQTSDVDAESNETFTANMVMEDKTLGIKVWVKDFVITEDGYYDTASGRVYISTHGYSDISTPVKTLYCDSCPGNYSEGQSKLTAGGHSATVTYYSNAYSIDVDLNNDGSIDDSATYTE